MWINFLLFQYRKVVISMFNEGFCFKKSDINKRLQEKLGSSLTNHIFPRFMGVLIISLEFYFNLKSLK